MQGVFCGIKNSMNSPFLPTAIVAAVLAGWPWVARTQEPAAPQQPVSPQQPVAPDVAPPHSESSSKQAKSKASHADDFLVRGTVFTPDGLALPGARLHIRRSTEKKFRWNDQANSRGEFAMRVKMGTDYEIVVRAKGFQEQAQHVSASGGERVKDLVFRLQRQKGKKS
jgi:hypothetical protein